MVVLGLAASGFLVGLVVVVVYYHSHTQPPSPLRTYTLTPEDNTPLHPPGPGPFLSLPLPDSALLELNTSVLLPAVCAAVPCCCP